MKYSVERKEENVVLCEDDDGGQIKLDISELPHGVREGDIIVRTESGYFIDREETESRRRKMAALQKSLFNKKDEKSHRE